MTQPNESDSGRCAICFQTPAEVTVVVKQPPGFPTREIGVCRRCADKMGFLEGQVIKP